MLGAADMPIGCALTFYKSRRREQKMAGEIPGHKTFAKREV
jgi:hypothetical protein